MKLLKYFIFAFFSFSSFSDENWMTCLKIEKWTTGEICVEMNLDQVSVIIYKLNTVEFIYSTFSGWPNIECDKKLLKPGRNCSDFNPSNEPK